MDEPRATGFAQQTRKKPFTRKASKVQENMAKEDPTFPPTTWAQSNPLARANELWQKSMKRMGGIQTPLLPKKARKRKSTERLEESVEELRDVAVDVLEGEDEVISSDEQSWTRTSEIWRVADAGKDEPRHKHPKLTEPTSDHATTAPRQQFADADCKITSTDQYQMYRTSGTWRDVGTKRDEPRNPPRRSLEPHVNPATAALRKQFADILSKISPVKSAAPKIRWTPDLPIPPPDGPDAPAETRPVVAVPTPPRVSKDALRKQKREEKRREQEEREMDEAGDEGRWDDS
ncbi:hypothetical protein V494_02304 [Pseudogymnoascus sp. VKM F-4513 (FW-928)]|nr:hypothetical protein V494_02304 [Pseudogymnoascus sp. VKM F-4513 (FW-928)]